MYKKSAKIILVAFCFLFLQITAQNPGVSSAPIGGEYIFEQNDAAHPCISALEYQRIEAEIANNNRLLGINNGASQNRIMTTLLNWPIKAAAGFTDCGFHFIGAFVDQDTTASNIKDFNCETNTYDGHRGTDIAIFPYGFYKMDNNQIEVVAAAAGTIIARSDGNFDRNCSSNNLTANYIIIQHTDGSEALYWHMKKNSVTAKTVGQTVAVGEYLGVVGSSGSSSGPHLHFEVWSGNTNATRKDPYSGACNTLNASTWWASQKPHTDPSIVKVSTNTTDLVLASCPTTDTPNESTSFTIPFQGAGLSPGYAKFYIFLREIPAGASIDLKILNPNNSTFNSWTYNVNTFYKTSYWGWSKLLPTIAGTYKFQATYNGITCSQNFDIITAAAATITASGPTTFCQGDSVILTANAVSSYLWNNGLTTRSITIKNTGNYTVKVTFANGSSATSATTSVTVNPLPTATITASGNTTFCQGDSVILTSSIGSSYIWSNVLTTRSITVKNTGSYSVKVTNGNNCSATSTVIPVTVNPLPTATITASGNTTFCQGDSVILTSSIGSSYLWSNGLTTRSITVKNTGSYSVKVTNANNCSKTSATTSITVNPLPTATITASGNSTFCQGDSVILTSSIGSSYLWSNGLTTRSITVKNTGSYSVKVTNANNCSKTSTVTSVTVRNPQNGLTIVLRNDTLFSPYVQPVKWYLTGNPTSIDVGLFHKCSQSGNYYVKGNDANGCTATSSTLFVNCNVTGIPTNTNNEQLQIFPNPAKNIIIITGSGIENGIYKLILRNLIGQIMQEDEIKITSNSIEKTISISDLANDIYFLSIETETILLVKKILKQN